MKIGERLKEKRQAANLSQKELADILHVSRQTISSWEVGRTYPDLEILVHISEFYTVPLDELLKEDSTLVEDISQKVKNSERRKLMNRFLSLMLVLVSCLGIYYAIQHYRSQMTNEAGLSQSDLLNTTWQLNFTSSQDIEQSILSFDQNSIAIFNQYNPRITPAESKNPKILDIEKEKWLERGLENGVTDYSDLKIELVEDTYIVTAFGFSQKYTRLSDTIIKDQNGTEYFRVRSSDMHADLHKIEEYMKEDGSESFSVDFTPTGSN